MKKRVTTLPAKLLPQLNDLYRLADWYRGFKPEQKTITISRELWDALQTRDVERISVNDGEMWIRGLRIERA